MFMGLKWRYDTTNGIWVPDFAYGETLAGICKIDGDEVNDAALLANGWTSVNHTNGGTISYDGTRVTFTATVANNQTAEVLGDHGGGVNDDYFLYGRFRAVSYVGPGSNPSCFLAIQDGAHTRTFGLRYTTTNTEACFFKISGSRQGYADSTVEFTTEKFLLIRWSGLGAKHSHCWVEGHVALPSPSATYVGTDHSASAAQRFLIGDSTGNAGGALTARNVVCARY